MTVNNSPAPYATPFGGTVEIRTLLTLGAVPCANRACVGSRNASAAKAPRIGRRLPRNPPKFRRAGLRGTLGCRVLPPPPHDFAEARTHPTVHLQLRSESARHAVPARKKTLYQTPYHHDSSLRRSRIALGPSHTLRDTRISMISKVECSTSALSPVPERSRMVSLPAGILRPTWNPERTTRRA